MTQGEMIIYTTDDGKEYSTLFYSLEMILAVGMRVRSARGTQFRKWANGVPTQKP